MPAFLLFCVIPVGGVVSIFGHTTYLQVVDLPIGALWILAMSGIGVYGVMLAGWSSGSKYPLLGSVRASAQLLSYEAAFGLAILAVLIQAGTLSTHDIVFDPSTGQYGTSWHTIFTDAYWLRTAVAFGIFLIAACAEVNHPPFDLVEAEQELVGGFNTEYSSIRFALFFLAEFMNVITMSGVIVTLFLGGPQPLKIGDFDLFGWVPLGLEGTAWVVLKVLAFLYIYVWFRATLPRLRYDQLMNFGWKLLIPVSLGWFLVLATLELARDEYDGLGPVLLAGAIAIAVLFVAYALFNSAVVVSRRNREREGAAF
jgi:NADH-quinone oxidoreductase subunit H